MGLQTIYRMKLQIKARVSKDSIGQPMLDFNKTEYRKAISGLAEGSTVLISISDQRTVDQNKLLHSLLDEISAYTGDSLEDMKVYMKHMFLGYVEHEVTGYECIEEGEDCEKFPVKKKIKELRSTTTLTKKEFADFITQIQAWAWENLSLNLSNIPE
jgi:hypothetical protein